MTECPECGIDLWCGCESCQKRRIEKGKCIPEWVSLYEDIDGELEMCGNCGYIMHADGWLDEEWRQYKALFQ